MIDGDTVEGVNLPVCFLLRDAESENKAIALTRSLGRFFPGTEWHAVPKWFADVGWSPLASTDLIFCCVDNDAARVEVAWASNELNIPAMNAGLAEDGSSRCSLAWFPACGAACPACLMPPAYLRSALAGSFAAGGSCSRRPALVALSEPVVNKRRRVAPRLPTGSTA